jgi:saccharopine dehydrogenase (NAD+, L-lysine-forming)
LVETGSWTKAPKDAIIVGLKELPESDDSIKHNHIYFAHCYKEQDGWKDILQRFKEGNGKIWDMEFLTFEDGRRVAAFGKSAGYAGMAVGVQAWAHNVSKDAPLTKLYPKEDFQSLANYSASVVQERLGEKMPSVLVIGGSGRCGQGATAAALDIGIPQDKIESWDTSNTAGGGPFKEILDYDILVNCIYLKDNVKPFIDQETIHKHADSKNLSVLVDVSCDYNNPANPLPIYDQSTTFDEPTLRVEPNIDVVAIDHLPTLVPSSSSEEFAGQLLPHLLDFNQTAVWERAEKLYEEMVSKV